MSATLRPRRADRRMQGYNEVIAFYVDRVLGFYRKPPIVGRAISSKVMHRYQITSRERVRQTNRERERERVCVCV
jgi:hypothetical protein